jgi:AsmA protein
VSLEAKLKGQSAPPAPVPAQTEFAELTATATIKNGILNNNDLRAATPFTRVAGKGTVDIPKERLNYIVSVKFTNSSDVKNNIPYEKMNAIPLDTIIIGTFSKPEIKIDYQKVLEQIAKKELKVQERKLKEKANAQIKKELDTKKKELEKKVGSELKKLFKF